MLRAAGGSVCIDPVAPVVMGCGETREPVGGVHDRLECNALVVRDDEACLVVIGVDALYVGPTLRSYVEDRFRGGLAPERIFMAASHTHSAPQLDPTKPLLGMPDAAHLARVCGLVGDLVERLLADPGEVVRVERSRYASRVMVNRRRRRLVSGAERRLVFNAVVMSPNPAATGRQYGHLISLVGRRGVVGHLWQLPCHPTSCPRGRGHRAGFPGVGRAALRRMAGGDVPVVFLQGFSGDLRPPAVRRPRGLRGWLRRAVLGVEFSAFTEAEFEAWCGGLCEELAAAFPAGEASEVPRSPERLVARRVVVPLERYHQGESGGRQASVHRVSIAGVTLLGVSAEPVSAWAEPLLEVEDTLIVPVGCIDDVGGYAPTAAVLREGGYEGDRFARHFNVGAPRHDYERSLRGQMEEALERAIGEVQPCPPRPTS